MNALSHFLVKLLVYFKQDSRTIYCFHGKTFEFSGLQKLSKSLSNKIKVIKCELRIWSVERQFAKMKQTWLVLLSSRYYNHLFA